MLDLALTPQGSKHQRPWWPLFVVVADPQIEIDLQLVDRTVQLFAERDPIKLVEQSFVEALTNAIRLRTLGLGAASGRYRRSRDTVRIRAAQDCRNTAAALGQHPQQLDLMAVEERQHAVIKEIGRRDRRLPIVQHG